MTKKLDRTSLMAACKPKLTEIKLPQGTVYAKQWLVSEADLLNSKALEMNETTGAENRKIEAEWRKLTLRYSICDSDGVTLWDDDTVDETLQLTRDVAEQLLLGALRANGVSQQQLAEATEAEGSESPN